VNEFRPSQGCCGSTVRIVHPRIFTQRPAPVENRNLNPARRGLTAPATSRTLIRDAPDDPWMNEQFELRPSTTLDDDAGTTCSTISRTGA